MKLNCIKCITYLPYTGEVGSVGNLDFNCTLHIYRVCDNTFVFDFLIASQITLVTES